MKGDSLVFEQVLLFGIGVVIFIFVFGIFLAYQYYFISVNTDNQMDQVLELVGTNIIKLSEKEFNSTALIGIPKAITDYPYTINLSNMGLGISVEIQSLFQVMKKTKLSPLYSINESFDLSGSAVSSDGTVIIYKKGDKIILRQQ